MLQVWVAPLSTSVATMLPVAVDGPVTTVTSFTARPASVTPPATSEAIPITGASLVPVRVMITVSVSVAPRLSVTVTVKLSVMLAPSARVSAAALSSV